MKYRASKTPLFSSLRDLIKIAAQDERSIDRINKNAQEPKNNISRRTFLKSTGSAAALLALGGIPIRIQNPKSAKIVIVGGGIAGLNAAYVLKKSGMIAEIYEGSSRIGGRIFTVNDVMGPGLSTEFGGEFIDSTHNEIFNLSKELGLEFMDREQESEKKLIRRAYYFEGRHHSEAEVIDAFKPFLDRIRYDVQSLPESFDFMNPGNAGRLDNISLAEYFHSIGISGWLKNLLEAAYVSEYGLELADQSALNFITLVSTDISDRFMIFGSSDERFKIKGGNSLITLGLAGLVKDRIHFSYKLHAIMHKGKGFTLTFQKDSLFKDIEADIVLLAIPFSVLRDVDLKIELPQWKRKAINELGYGTNTKVMTGFTKRFWRENNYAGEVFSDQFQLAWDNSQLQNGQAGGITYFSGGKAGLDAGKGTIDFQSENFIKKIENIFPGAIQSSNGKNQRFYWPEYPFTKGSYSAYKPGQWTTIHGAEAKSCGNLFFAGEHCSPEFQGFMNGGAASGRSAALEILKLLD